MAYIGNTPAEAYTSIDKQTITGNGGASYTLDHAVANENEIEVFVNNVRQEPSVAYTVSNTTLSMTGNVEVADDFYVVFQGKAIQTTSHPEGQDLKARDGTFSGDLQVDGSSANLDSQVNVGGNITVGTNNSLTGTEGGEIAFRNNDATANVFHVDVAGTNCRLFTTTNNQDVIMGQLVGTGGEVALYTNAIDRMRIDSSGNVNITGDSLTLDDSLTYAQPIARNYNIIAPTINDGGYQRAWTRLGTFASSGRGIFQFRMNYQGDHNYSRFFSCVGEIHQWESSTGVFNMSVYGTGGGVTGQFKTTSSRELWFRETGSWSHKMCLEIIYSQLFTVDMATYQKNQSPPTGTVRSLSGTGSISVEASWGS